MLYELCSWGVGGPASAHPDLLAGVLTERQVAGWIAWMKKEPRGERRADVRSAVQTAYLRQVHVDGAENPETFLVRFGDTTVIADAHVDQLVEEFLSCPLLPL